MKNKNFIFNKEYIQNFAQPIDEKSIDNFTNNVCTIIAECAKSLKSKSTNILDYGILLVGDNVSGSEMQNSESDIFLLINSPRLELSTINAVKNPFKNFWKKVQYAWIHRKDSKKKQNRRAKNKQKELEIKTKNQIDSEKYNYNDFRIDFAKELSNYFTSTTMIYIKNYCIKIVGKDELMMPVNLYISLVNDSTLKLFNQDSYKFITINFNQRYINVGKKIDDTKKQFRNILRIFNALYYNIMNEKSNLILLESLIFNCPNNLFVENDVYQSFLNVVNFLSVTSIFQLKSICNENEKLINEKLCNTQISKYEKFLRLLKNSIENNKKA